MLSCRIGNYARFGAVSGDWDYREGRIGESVLLRCLAKNRTEEGELQCVYHYTCKANLIK